MAGLVRDCIAIEVVTGGRIAVQGRGWHGRAPGHGVGCSRRIELTSIYIQWNEVRPTQTSWQGIGRRVFGDSRIIDDGSAVVVDILEASHTYRIGDIRRCDCS